MLASSSNNETAQTDSEDRTGGDDTDADEAAIRDEEPTITCIRTGFPFTNSEALQLLTLYEDGIHPPVAVSPFSTEPVFCRICREGLHDDADQEQPDPAAEAEDPHNRDESPMPRSDTQSDTETEPEARPSRPVIIPDASTHTETNRNGPVIPHPQYLPNHQASDNPMLAPCECSGSMAFVHYLCVEQWRCRSRHPDAQNGLACETCGSLYALPPPSARRAMEPQEDWLEAMPPHVMQALRQPHFFWHLGAVVVRRRWLRPLAPVVLSPIVSLYCRGRRLLKKRGVARRRWACSLCRRRARWKCVRCLRSYYCSRQCQNVSWHTVHKHLCYKPVRFWWSVLVYGALAVLLFPGVLRDPLMYDLGLFFVPVSFVVMGVLWGGIATAVKKMTNMDLRGRMLELTVVLCTTWLSLVSWGLIRGYFGDGSACQGTLGSYDVMAEDLNLTLVLRVAHKGVFQPAARYYLFWDRLCHQTFPWLRRAICIPSSDEACFEHLPHVNPDFFLREEGGGECAADLLMVVWLYATAAFTFVATSILKKRERDRRRHGRHPVRGGPRLHQD